MSEDTKDGVVTICVIIVLALLDWAGFFFFFPDPNAEAVLAIMSFLIGAWWLSYMHRWRL